MSTKFKTILLNFQMQRLKIEYVIWISILSFSIIVSFQHNLKELMLPHQLLTAPLFQHCMTKSTHFHLLTPSPFISSGKIANPLFLISPPTIRGRRVQAIFNPSRNLISRARQFCMFPFDFSSSFYNLWVITLDRGTNERGVWPYLLTSWKISPKTALLSSSIDNKLIRLLTTRKIGRDNEPL